MLITTYLIIVRTWRQIRGPLADEQKNKLWYIQTIEYYSGLKSYQTEKTWRKHKCIFLSERSHGEKAICCIMHMIFWKRKNYEDGKRSDQISHSVVSDPLQPHESQHARPPCPSPTPGVHADSRPPSQWCHPAISSSVVPFFFCPQSLPASESFPMS